jgi:hypothetical protein
VVPAIPAPDIKIFLLDEIKDTSNFFSSSIFH